MIEKKDSRANLEKNRVTIFGIGLLAAGSFTLAAFTYTSPLEVEEAKIASAQSVVSYQVQQEDAPEEKPEEEVLEEVAQDEPTLQTEALEELSENVKKKQNENKSQDATSKSGNQKRIKGPEKHRFKIRESLPDAVEYTDVDAAYVGGHVEMIKFIQVHLEYPEDAIAIGDQGKAYVRFIVERDGSISNVKATGEVGRSIKREAERIVRSFPKWIPGELNGKRVRSYVRLPITFVLD